MFWTILLDAKNKLKSKPVAVTQGLLDASLVHPREVFQQAIRQGAAAVVLVHNHPSGDPTPSAEDVRITKQLGEAGRRRVETELNWEQFATKVLESVGIPE